MLPRGERSAVIEMTQVKYLVPFLLLAITLPLLACQSGPPPRPVSEASARALALRHRNLAIQTVGDLSIPAPDGTTFKLADLRGKVVVIDFWGTWCPPCRKQAPMLAELYTRYRAQGLEVVGLSLNKLSEQDEVTKFMKEVGINYRVGYADQKLSGAFLNGTEDETGSAPIPQLFVLARDGSLLEHLIGDRPEHAAQLEKVISQQLSLVASSNG
jgi:thiol-disulfide isomerase/thioredoxin